MKPGTVLTWADGEYNFHLGIKDWQELSRKTVKLILQLGVSETTALAAADPPAIYERVRLGRSFAGEGPEIIFQALVGGGMTPQEAAALRRRYADDQPLTAFMPIAYAVMGVSMFGSGPPEPEEKKAAVEEAPSSPSAASTKTAQRSATRRAKSMA